MDGIEDRIRERLAREIKAHLARSGVNQSSLARQIGCHRVQVGYIVNCRRYTPQVQQAVARAVKAKPHRLFGPFVHPSLIPQENAA